MILAVLFINVKKKIGVSRNTLSETIPHIELNGELKTEFTEKGILSMTYGVVFGAFFGG